MPVDDYGDEIKGSGGSSTPFDDDATDGYEVSVGGVLPGRTTKDIDEKSRFNTMEDGKHVLRIKGFGGIPDQKSYDVYVGDTNYTFTGRNLRVIMCLSDDEHTTVSDFFTLPPENEEEKYAYNNGTKKPNDKRNAGFHARKLKSFLGHLGLIDPNTGEPLPEAGRLGNWKVWPDGTPRYFTAETQLGDEQPDKNGKPRRFPNIVLFSYEDFIPPASNAGGAQENGIATVNPHVEVEEAISNNPAPPAPVQIKPPVVTQRQPPTARPPATAPSQPASPPAAQRPAARPPAKPKAAVNYDV
jgi:hypothetical protein